MTNEWMTEDLPATGSIRTNYGKQICYSRFRAFFRFSAPATVPVAARLTAFDIVCAAGTGATFESAVPRGEGDVSRSLPDSELTDLAVGIVFDGEVCRGPDETGFAVRDAVIAEGPFDTGFDAAGAGGTLSSDADGVANSGGGI